MHENHPGIDSSWTIPLEADHYLTVIIWQDCESMYAAMKKTYPNDLSRDYVGRCFSMTQARNIETGEILAPRKFGEVHLVIDRIGGGYVAHELQHAVNYWSEFKKLNFVDHDEQIAKFSGDLTNLFWNSFYSHYQQEQKQPPETAL